MSNPFALIVEVTGQYRSGTSGKGNPYCMYTGFVHLPNVPYPQKASFYCETPQQVPQPGAYECDVNGDIKDGRVVFEIDPRQGRRVNTPATAKSA
ncbi:propanediol utilization protein [Pseudomonas sp. SIMBA_065]